jgi:chemotaxis response regulator CheB
VIVISSLNADKSVFRALELGAVDFVSKPQTSAERRNLLGNVLKEKLDVVRALTPASGHGRRRPTTRAPTRPSRPAS